MGNYIKLKDVRTMHLHRIQTAQRIDKEAVIPEGFSLDEYLATGVFGYRRDVGTIRIKALFEKDATIHLEETPLSADQQLTEQPDGDVLVEASVADTGQLRWWLLGFGGRVEVLEPQGLRDELKGHAERMAGRYQK
jgi:predicted DNA-binding transcriptional regulator YafY